MTKLFETEKHGYRIRDVEAYILQIDSTLSQQKQYIADLKKELEDKDLQIKAFKQKQDLIVKSIVSAVQKAEQIEQLIKQKYANEMAHLDAFHKQWTSYYDKLIQAYPLPEQLSPIKEFNKKVSSILVGDNPPQKKFEEARAQFYAENQRLANSEYINSDNNFNQSTSKSSSKKYVGFIPINDDELQNEMQTDDFNPEESIRQMLRREAAQEEAKQKKLIKQGSKVVRSSNNTQKNVQKKAENKSKSNSNSSAATMSLVDLGISESGFSFEEALNPIQQLSDILKDIGVKPDVKQ